MKRALSILFLAAAVNCAPAAPTATTAEAEAVAAVVAARYVDPDSLRVEMSARQVPGRVTRWDRTYGAVPVLADTKTVDLPDGTRETRWRRELVEPPRLRREMLLGGSMLMALPEAMTATAHRLVYLPRFDQVPLKPVVENAADVELVVAGYDVAYELDRPDDLAFVDAYTGTLLRTAPKDTSETVFVPTVRYGAQQLDVSRDAQGNLLLKDPVRTGRYFMATSVQTGWTAIDDDDEPPPDPGDDTPPGPIPLPTVFNRRYEQGVGALQGLPVPHPTYNVMIGGGPAQRELDLAFGLREAWDYYFTTFGRIGLSNDRMYWPSAVIAWITVESGGLNALYRDGVIRYRPGPTNDFSLLTLDVLGHEFSHGVFQAEISDRSNAYYFGDHGGINEATADLFGEMVQTYFRRRTAAPGIVVKPNWTIGEDGTAFRDMCRPARFGQPVEWSGLFNALPMDPHDTSGPLNRVFCLLAEGVRPLATAPPGDWQTSPRLPAGVAGLGDEAVARLWYEALPRLDPRPAPLTYQDARAVMLEAATALFGVHSSQYKAVEDVFSIVLVGMPADRTAPVITNGPARVRSYNDVNVDVTDDGCGVKVVWFWLDGQLVGTDVTAPWAATLALIPDRLPPATHTLVVTAEDNCLNRSSATFTPWSDDTGPAITFTVTPVSPENRSLRSYRVQASDAAGIDHAELRFWYPGSVGPVLASGAGLGTTLDQTFTIPLTNFGSIAARVHDSNGNFRTKVLGFVIDTSPPALNAAPLHTESSSVEGDFTLKFCPSDPSGIDASTVTLEMTMSGNPLPWAVGGPLSGCWQYTVHSHYLGLYHYSFRVKDVWGNELVSSGSNTLNGIAPVVGTPSVATPAPPVGQAIVAASYSAGPSNVGAGFSSIDCDVWLGSTRVEHQIFFPVAPADHQGHTFVFNGLIPGTTYTVYVIARRASHREAVAAKVFTVANSTPQDVVFLESENNDFSNVADVLPTGSLYNVLRGTLPAASSVFTADFDWLYVPIPIGKKLCFAGAATNGVAHPARVVSDTLISIPHLPIPTDLKPSRAQIGSGDWVCDGEGLSGTYLYVSQFAPYPQANSSAIAYDILIRFEPL